MGLFNKTRFLNSLDKPLSKVGLVRKSAYESLQRRLANTIDLHIKEMERERSAKVDEIVNAVRTVHMVKARLKRGSFSDVAMNGEICGDPTESHIENDYPPTPEWYQISTRLDIAAFRRIYSDLDMSFRSYGYEMFKNAILREVEANMAALMRIEK